MRNMRQNKVVYSSFNQLIISSNSWRKKIKKITKKKQRKRQKRKKKFLAQGIYSALFRGRTRRESAHNERTLSNGGGGGGEGCGWWSQGRRLGEESEVLWRIQMDGWVGRRICPSGRKGPFRERVQKGVARGLDVAPCAPFLISN